jgi:membrane-associated phospholipid phosphatase
MGQTRDRRPATETARAWIVATVLALAAVSLSAASTEAPPAGDCPAADLPGDTTTSPAESLSRRAWKAIREEARRYGRDSVALVSAPLHWNKRDWEKAAGAGLILGGLMFADEDIDRYAQKHRTHFTDRVAGATTDLGGQYGFHASFAMLAAGILFNHENLRDTGREAIESGIFATLLDKYVVKRAFGRERPFESNGETVFVPGSSHDSFPSGHATQAFAVASVVAARSKGWIIPSLAYAAATVVAFDRVNSHVHFASDVVAGAFLGTAVGRFIVHRHRSEKEGVLSKQASLDVVPIPGGLALSVRY